MPVCVVMYLMHRLHHFDPLQLEGWKLYIPAALIPRYGELYFHFMSYVTSSGGIKTARL
jgi:hypothetical protein